MTITDRLGLTEGLFRLSPAAVCGRRPFDVTDRSMSFELRVTRFSTLEAA
jgi:hypothetical protein